MDNYFVIESLPEKSHKNSGKKQEHFSEDEWQEHLLSHSPHFDVLPVGALVPQDDMAGYVAAGGIAFP